jgi:selenocysteine-specific elongation factor
VTSVHASRSAGVIFGTAGHVDHGKTSLVKALTGVDTDRLPEEKRRGITLELGFAQLPLAGGLHAGLVDVPGHERFVKAMAAGAGGVDVAILVVAADEGVMPQTREHVDICSLLGVRAGVVALTKADLLPSLGPDGRQLLEEELRELCHGTFLEPAAILPVSVRTGEGLEALRAELARLAAGLHPRPVDGPAFLPVDRAFTLKGFGTVVTGTLLSGRLQVGEEVALLPGSPGPLRVRTLHAHGHELAEAQAGSRVAVNLPGLEAGAVRRGDVLVRQGELDTVRTLDVELSVLAAASSPLRPRARLLLHLGTAQVEASVGWMEQSPLEPGSTGLVQLRLARPVAALPGQRFILRGSRPLPGRGATVAGGRVLAVGAPRRRKGAEARLRPLQHGEAAGALPWLLEEAGYRGLTAEMLFGRSGLSARALGPALERMGARGEAVLVDRASRLYVAGRHVRALVARARAALEQAAASGSFQLGLPREELRQRLAPGLDPRLYARVLAQLEAGKQAELHGDSVRLPGQVLALGAGDAEARDAVLGAVQDAGLAPPIPSALASALKLPQPRVEALLKLLAASGELVKVAEGLYFHPGPLAALRASLQAHLAAHGHITTQAFKDLVGQSRKYVIPLSEHFDREKVTLRVGDKRVPRRA